MFLNQSCTFILKEDIEGKIHRICEAVFITKTITDLITNKQKVKIVIYNQYQKNYFSIIINRDELDTNIASKLRGYGLSLSLTTASSLKEFLEFLFETEKEAAHIYKHSHLGFATVDKTRCFLAYNPIGLKASPKSLSIYTIPSKNKPRGTYKSWRKVIRREILGRPKLELALALAALAPISHILREAGEISEIPILALIGESSIGKTTVLRIIASIYGVAKVGDGIITNMHSTVNGLYAQLAAQYGYPALFDEVTGITNTDLTPLIYYMPNGHDKIRCNNDGTVKEPIKFSGAIFFSSEKSLFESTINTGGLHARLFELYFKWTSSRINAENLESDLVKNCGTAVYPLLKWILNHEEWLCNKYKEERDILLNQYPYSDSKSQNITNRILKICAQIMVAAHVVSTVFDLSIGINEIRKALIKNMINNHNPLDDSEGEGEKINFFILDNLSKFPARSTHPSALSTIWGFTKPCRGRKEVWIRKDIMEKFISKNTKRPLKVVLKDLVDNGWLFQDKSRHRVFNENIAGISAKFYRFSFTEKNECTKYESEVTAHVNTKKKSPQLNSLLKN